MTRSTPQAITTTQAPAAIGAYSQAVRTDGLVFVSGQLPVDPATGKIEATDAASQADRAISNIEAILAQAGLTLSNVVKTTVLLADIADFAAVNQAYAARFVTEPKPARAAFQVAALPLGALVEIEAIAWADEH
ncbi:MAG: Rid family detoxifying hydrolase [Propionibacteriaceae bacterium]|jgi:2-iminobutanoate/2-iminopropanoate deaminase|nr:Rid family detoxifying hydrolase [Propionibacteriaceae bacterium]